MKLITIVLVGFLWAWSLGAAYFLSPDFRNFTNSVLVPKPKKYKNYYLYGKRELPNLVQCASLVERSCGVTLRDCSSGRTFHCMNTILEDNR